MKKEAGKKSKLWLWLLLALVAVAAAVAVVLFLLPGGNPQEEVPGEETVQSEIYWNIDGAYYMEISDVDGMSAREVGEDGFYHIVFLVNGQRQELLVADKRLVNYIDSLQLMGLQFDENGYVIDALDIKTIATEIAKEFYVKKLENGILEINSSRAMNGMPLQLTVDENTIISDMTLEGDELGKAATPGQMDKVLVYQSPDGSKTFVYIVERAPEPKAVYWRVERCWDATAGKTTREPDKDGVYTLEFACDGKIVELKCKDATVVGTIDSSAVLTGQFSFEFDEEGYIVSIVNVAIATSSIYAAGDYHVTAVEGDTVTFTRLSSGNDQGKVVTLKVAEDCKIFQCCQYACYDEHCGERVDSVQVGDRVNVYSNLDNEANLIFVTRRLYGGPMYYNFNRQYGGNMEVGTLREKTGGYYVFEMLCEGKVVKVKVKDKKLADQMESIYNRCMGLDVNEKGVVTRLYDATCVYGGAVLGTESYVTELSGPVITIASSSSTSTWNSMLSPTCKVYNVIQGEYGAKVGGELTLQLGDQITAFRNNESQLEIIFVLSRPVNGGKVYYNLQRKYNSTTQETNRVPNEEGYYEYLFACEGKQVTGKTKSKGMASFIDAQTAPLVGLKINKNGIITNAYAVASVLKQQVKSCNYRYVEKVTKKSFNTYYYPSATPDKKVVDDTTWTIAKNCKVYNVSTAVESYRGEKATLKNGDYIQAIRDLKTNEITQIWIMTRNPAYGVKNYEAYCEHCEKKVTWEPYIGKVTSGVKHYFLFTDMFYSQGTVGTKATDDATFDTVLDLNGKTLSGDGRCFLVYDHLTIMDTKGGGKLMGTNPSSVGDKHSGGCIMVAGGKLDILGGTLGQSEKSTDFGTIAGVIYLAGGTEVNMYGGTLMNGTTTTSGGVIGNYGGTFNMYGGEIKGGTSPLGANIYSSGTLNLQGGTIDGGIEMSASAKVQLSGKLTITGTGIKIPAGKKLDLSQLDAEARIAVQGTGIFTEAYDNIADYEAMFTPGGLEEDKIVVKENALCYISSGPSDFVLDTDNDGMAVCPACNQDVAWTPVTGRLGASMTGHYYVNADINDSSSQWATITTKNAALCIHLNGHTVTTSGRIATVGSGGTINIMGDGTIIGEGDYTGTDAESYTKATLVASTGPINLYGNVKVISTAEGKPVMYNRVNSTVSGNVVMEAHESGMAIQNEKGTLTLNGGKFTGGALGQAGTIVLDGATEIDLIAVQSGAKLKVMGDWTGKADAVFENPMVDGAVPAANGESTGAFTGLLNSLDLETAEPTQLFGKSGRLCTENAEVTPPEPDFVLDSDGDNKAVCPVCGGAEVEWTPLEAGARPGTSTSGHFYLLADSTNTDAQYATTTQKTQTICLHLNGKNLTTSGRIAIVGSGGSINIMGEGNITSNASSDYAEATLVISSGGTMSLYDNVTVTIAVDGKPVAEVRNNSSLVLNDNAKIVAKAGGIGILNKGKLFMNEAVAVDNITVETTGKVTVNGNWTGSAKVTFAAALVDGVVPEANGASTGAFTGSLTMGTEKLVGSDGKLMLESAAPSDPVDPPVPPAQEGELVLDGSNQAQCPVCEKLVTWTAVTESLGSNVVDGGHYYLTDDYDNPYQFMTVTGGKTVCFHNNGYTLTYPSRIFVTGATLNLMGSGSIISKTTTEDQLGTVVAAWANGVINIYGGNISTESTMPALKLHGDNSVKVNVYGDAVIENADIHKGTLTLYGNSRIDSINVQTTGKLAVDASWTGSAKVTFGAELVDGVVPEANGASTGSFTGSLTMGTEKLVGSDGKLMLESAAQPPVQQDELVLDGNNNGYCEACKATVQWTDLHTTQYNRIGWKQDDAAADVHYHFYLSADMDNTQDLQYGELYNNTTCLHTNGHTLKIRSRIRMGSGATMNVLGSGSITTDSSASNASYNNALFFINSTAVLNIYGGTYSTAGVPVLMINDTKTCQINLFEGVVVNGGAELKSGVLTLDGNATITSVSVAANAKLVVNAGWSGTAGATFASGLTDGEVPAANGASTGAFTGTLLAGEQKLVGKDGKLVVDTADPQVVKGNTVATAAAAMDFTSYQTGTAVRCPICDKDVTWEPINGMGKGVVDGGHYYVNKDITGDGIFLTVNGKTVCVHLNGKTLTYGARIFATSASTATPGTLNLMGSGTVSSSNAHADYGTGTIHAASAGIINLYGGIYKSTGANTKAVVHTTGGTVSIYSGATVDSNTGTNVLLEKGTVNLYGGTVKNGTGFLSGSNRLGGNVFLKSTDSVFNMIDGTVSGGTATYGGNIRGEAGTTITMDGGAISGGTGTGGGGNVNTNGTFTMTGGTVSGGVSGGMGGNIWSKSGTVTIGKDATVSGGSGKEGGNIAVTEGATLNTSGMIFNGTVVSGGSAPHGGNISGGSNTTINITGGKIYGGVAAGQAGNIRTYNGTINMTAGEIYGGTATTASNHNMWVAGSSGVLNFTGGTIKGVDGTNSSGTAINIGTGSTLNLGGTASAVRDDGISKGLVYVYNGKLNVLNDWTGSASVKFASAYTAGTTIPETVAQCGAMAESVFTAGGSYTGTLVNEVGDAVKILGVEGALVLDNLPAAE